MPNPIKIHPKDETYFSNNNNITVLIEDGHAIPINRPLKVCDKISVWKDGYIGIIIEIGGASNGLG